MILLFLVSCAARRVVRPDAQMTLPSSGSAVPFASKQSPRLLDMLARAEAFRGPVPLPRASGSVRAGLARHDPNSYPMMRTSGATMAAGGEIKQQADSVPLPLAKGLKQALDDLIGKLYSILKEQEQISGRKFAPIESRFVDISRKYDVSKSGALTLPEFKELVSDGIVWRSLLFPQSDADSSGTLDTRELVEAIAALGLQVEQDKP